MDCSVIICTRNRALQLYEVLQSITKLVLPASLVWELIVVDNGSTDPTPEIIESFKDKLPIRCVSQPVPGLSNARNAGVEAACGDYIVWTDDDVLVVPDWLAAFLRAFRQYPEAAVFAGKVTPVLQEPTPAWFAESVGYLGGLLAKRDFGPLPLPLNFKDGLMPFGACFAVRTREQKQYHYDIELGVAPGRAMGGEEIDVFERIIKAGHAGWWVPDAEVKHIITPARQTLAYIFQYYEANGIYTAHLAKRQNEQSWNFAVLRTVLSKLPVWFILFRIAKALKLKIWVRCYASYAHKCGMLKFWRAHALLANNGPRSVHCL